MKTPLAIWGPTAIMTAFLIVAFSILIFVSLKGIYYANPEAPILRKLGIPTHPQIIAQDYIKANIEALSGDIEIYITHQIPALTQINHERMTTLIQNNTKFQYSEAQEMSGYTYKIPVTAHVDIRIDENERLTGNINGTLPFLFVVDKQNPQATKYYVQPANAYFGLNRTELNSPFKKAPQSAQTSD